MSLGAAEQLRECTDAFDRAASSPTPGPPARRFRPCRGPFPRLAKLKRNETVFFSFIVYKSRADRDSVNRKVMNDPRMAKMMDMKSLPFDVKRMAYGGFKVLVDF